MTTISSSRKAVLASRIHALGAKVDGLRKDLRQLKKRAVKVMSDADGRTSESKVQQILTALKK